MDTLDVAQRFITTVETTQHVPRGRNRIERREQLFDLVRALGDMVESVFPGKSDSSDEDSEEVEEVL